VDRRAHQLQLAFLPLAPPCALLDPVRQLWEALPVVQLNPWLLSVTLTPVRSSKAGAQRQLEKVVQMVPRKLVVAVRKMPVRGTEPARSARAEQAWHKLVQTLSCRDRLHWGTRSGGKTEESALGAQGGQKL